MVAESASFARDSLKHTLLGWLLTCYRPVRPTESVWRWADDHVFLDGKASPRPGFYRSSETPWTRRFQDIFICADFTECLVMKSSRTGFTEAALNVVRYMPEHAPGQVLICLDSKDEARKVSNDRLSTSLRSVAGDNYSSDPDDDGTLTKRLLNMTVLLAGSYSGGVFRNKWLRLGILDEIEVNPEVPGEGPTLDLMRSRFNGVDGARLLAMSKPKKSGSIFHRQVAGGTCEVFLAPCPHCSTWQEFSWDGTSATDEIHLEKITAPLKCKPAPLGRVEYEHARDMLGTYDQRAILRDTFYRCVSGCKITEADKPAILAQINREGEHWLQTNPSPLPGRCSQHVSDLLSPYAEVTWGKLASMWVSFSTQTERDHFRNNHLGLPVRDRIVAVTQANILDCRSPYRRGAAPFVPDVGILTWDTQDDRLKWVRTAWRLTDDGKAGECAVVDWGVTTFPDELYTLLAQPFATPDGKTATCWRGMGDSAGHRTAEIYDLCLNSGGRLWPSKGCSRSHSPIYQSRVQYGLREVELCWYFDDLFKTRLYIEQIAAIGELRAWQKNNPGKLCARLHLPEDCEPRVEVDDDIVYELSREQRVEVETRSGFASRWTELKGNDYGDGVKIAYVAFDFLRPALVVARARRLAAEAEAKKAQASTPAN